MQGKRVILLFLFKKKTDISALSKPQSAITRVSSCADKPDFVLNCRTACTFFFLCLNSVPPALMLNFSVELAASGSVHR